MKTFKVMFVDDEYMILEGLKVILDWESLGFEIVKTAKNAPDAISYLAENNIDLLITDITMPEMSGLELVEAAQKNAAEFFTIILSGYQEFDYVRQGLALGVKDYLVKPVDRLGLERVVKEIYQELLQQEENKRQHKLYQESILKRWLEDELNDVEFEQLLGQYKQVEVNGPYTPLHFSGGPRVLKEIQDFFRQAGQEMEITDQLSEGHYLLVYRGERRQLLLAERELMDLIPSQWQLMMGETITTWENLYQSYEKIKQLRTLQEFYPDLLPAEQIIPVDISHEENENLPYLSFNKALLLGDVVTIKKELDQIFDHLLQTQAAPDRVKSITFLLFTDIFRQFPTLSQEYYEEIINSMRSSETVIDLQRILDDVLEKTTEQVEVQRYSEIVQEVIDITQREFRHELTLKVIAERLHLSVVYLGQLFKKETDLSFNQYLNEFRIKEAQKLLLHSQGTIKEIAEEIGYNNTNYFSKMFKKLTGMTPKEFRETYYAQYNSH